MARIIRDRWLLCLLVSLVLASTERLAAQEAPPPTAAVAPPAAAQAYDPEHPVAPPPTRAQRRRQRLIQQAHPRPSDPGVVIGAGLMIVGGIVVIASASPALMSAALGGHSPDLSPTTSVALTAGIVTLGVGALLLVTSLVHRKRHSWAALAPPTAAGGAPSTVLLRF